MCVSCHCFSSMSEGKAIVGCECGCHQPPQPEAPERVWLQCREWLVFSHSITNGVAYIRADLSAASILAAREDERDVIRHIIAAYLPRRTDGDIAIADRIDAEITARSGE